VEREECRTPERVIQWNLQKCCIPEIGGGSLFTLRWKIQYTLLCQPSTAWTPQGQELSTFIICCLRQLLLINMLFGGVGVYMGVDLWWSRKRKRSVCHGKQT